MGGKLPQPLESAACVRQVSFCFPHLADTRYLKQQQYAIFGVRQTQLRDGQHLTWWCNCWPDLNTARSTYSGKDFPAETSQTFLAGRPVKCEHLLVLEVGQSFLPAYTPTLGPRKCHLDVTSTVQVLCEWAGQTSPGLDQCVRSHTGPR